MEIKAFANVVAGEIKDSLTDSFLEQIFDTNTWAVLRFMMFVYMTSTLPMLLVCYGSIDKEIIILP